MKSILDNHMKKLKERQNFKEEVFIPSISLEWINKNTSDAELNSFIISNSPPFTNSKITFTLEQLQKIRNGK